MLSEEGGEKMTESVNVCLGHRLPVFREDVYNL